MFVLAAIAWLATLAAALVALALTMHASPPLVVVAHAQFIVMAAAPSSTIASVIRMPAPAPLTCDDLAYTQSLRPVASHDGSTPAPTADALLPQYKLAFVNRSPQHALSLLEVQYRVNDGALVNVRLIGPAPAKTASLGNGIGNGNAAASTATASPITVSVAPPFVLRAGDRVDYRFAYQLVDASHELVCHTPTFHVTGEELMALSRSSSSSSASNVAPTVVLAAAAPSTTVRASIPPVRSIPSVRSAPTSTAVHESAQYAERMPPPVHLEERTVERNADVCPLIPFRQQLQRVRLADTSGDHHRPLYRYALRFENLSPTDTLTFVDAHVQLNDHNVANYRLFSDPSLPEQHRANQARALEGLPLQPHDTLLYAFTYGVGTRACNTPTFKYVVEADEA